MKLRDTLPFAPSPVAPELCVGARIGVTKAQPLHGTTVSAISTARRQGCFRLRMSQILRWYWHPLKVGDSQPAPKCNIEGDGREAEGSGLCQCIASSVGVTLDRDSWL